MGQRIIDFDDGFTSENVPTGASLGDLELLSTSYLYFGDSETNGSYRFGLSGSELVLEIRESGSWITVETFTRS